MEEPLSPTCPGYLHAVVHVFTKEACTLYDMSTLSGW
jgi:hypothetical protein